VQLVSLDAELADRPEHDCGQQAGPVGVEQRFQGGLVRPRFREIVQRERELEIRVEPVQPPVAFDVLDVGAKGVSYFSTDRIKVLEDPPQDRRKG